VELLVTDAPRSKRWRGRRARGVPRARVLAAKNITREVLFRGAIDVELAGPPVDVRASDDVGRLPRRARPCPWVSCKHHLYLDVNAETGSIKFNFPDLEPWELQHTCSLDVAERGGATLEEVGEIMNLTRERIRQVELKGFHAMKAAAIDDGLDETALADFPHPEGNHHPDIRSRAYLARRHLQTKQTKKTED
jgi:hypothetical protein